MGQRAAEAAFGPRTFRIQHIHEQEAAAAAAEPSSPCEVHAAAFQDCINQNGSDISRCQFYVNILNDCRRRGQAAIVETS
ncbi:hypothetical protein U9M48_037661 [Paspalum notatum var. saurae]|uniref:CHCH domain-containing protein n=1 Tax=Paspalum notatum var. saurae TaxID=547442 RepID=A0AAQ3XCN0_PASNO